MRGVKNLDQTVKSSKAFTLSLTAGILILINAAGLAIVARWFLDIMPVLPGSTGNDPMLFYTLSAIGLILGLLVLFATLMLRNKPANKKVWGIMIIVFSVPSVIMGGGFIVGFILGIAGGVKAIKWKN
ncbi:MAG: DUF6114 domain-containing protein [Candidatus Bathyarchaeota archaeon]|nr:DUF6114 domain-containing protein [Candidatus Bathyarchaeota archaeon]